MTRYIQEQIPKIIQMFSQTQQLTARGLEVFQEMVKKTKAELFIKVSTAI